MDGFFHDHDAMVIDYLCISMFIYVYLCIHACFTVRLMHALLILYTVYILCIQYTSEAVCGTITCK